MLFFCTPMARSRKTQAASTEIVLRLKQNAFVNGKFEAQGFEKSFSSEEAKRRLSRTRLWEIA